ncbi:TM0106 family RecB-like putative nuclease [Nitrospira sp. Kam-Ns4a]
MTLTAQALYNLTKCAHRVYLDANGDPAEKSEVSSFVKLLWELGLQTEREYLALLGDLPVADLQALPVDEAWRETRRLMGEGAPLIYQGCLRDGVDLGRPDLLLKHEGMPSKLGPYLYEPIDIKAGKGWEERDGKRTKFKEHYAFQVLFYRMLLERIQGALPPLARIINVDKQVEAFDPAAFQADFEQALAAARRLTAGTETSEPVLGSHCQLCPWLRKCERWVTEQSDPTGLFFVGRQKFQLKAAGLRTIEDIARMDVAAYLAPGKRIAGLGEKSLRRMKTRAQVRLAGRPEIRPGYRFPREAREVYFDIEDDPTRGVTYLFGLLIKDRDGEPRFDYVLARRPDEEEIAARAFWAFLATAEDDVYYVYSHKERTTLRQLMERYALDPAVFDRYRAREYDLYQKLIVEHSDWPAYSYGIKQIAKLIGFSWRDPDPSGANSIAWYNEYLADPSNEAALMRILRYNEDDCRAMLAIKNYFERAAAPGGDGLGS